MRRVQADDARLYLWSGATATTRFANNGITQNVASRVQQVYVTVAFGKQTGSSNSATLQPDDIEAAIRRAEAVARRSPADPEYLPSLGPGQWYRTVPPPDSSTVSAGPEERAKAVATIVSRAKRADLTASGTVEVAINTYALLTKNGLFVYAPETTTSIGCTMTGKTSSGWARDGSPRFGDLNAAALADDAIRQARLSANPRALKPGRYTTVLMPSALSGLMWPLLNGLSARQTAEGLTYLSGKVGQRLVGENITLRSAPQNPRLTGLPFDDDGLPIQPRVWVDRGVIGKTLTYDRFTAQKNGVEAVPLLNTIYGLCMDGGTGSPEDLIKNVERGVLVSHFWYIRDIKPVETLLTGMTRDAVFYIENGKIAYGLKQMRWNDSTLRVLSHIREMSRLLPALDDGSGLALLPAVTVEDFNFVSGSDF